MPCISEPETPRIAGRPLSDAEYADRLQARLDVATRVACNALTALDKLKTGQNFTLSEETVRWWEAHKKADEARRINAATDAIDAIRKICDNTGLSFDEVLAGVKNISENS